MRIKAAAEHALAHEVVVLRMLDHGAGNHIPQALPGKTEALDGTAQGGRKHVLVAQVRVGAIGTSKRNARPAQNGDAPDSGADEHESLPVREYEFLIPRRF